MGKIIFFLFCITQIYGKTSLSMGLSAGALHQSGVFQAVNQDSWGGSFESKRNPYGVPAYLGALQFGVRHMQGAIYLGAHLYYTINTFNKTIYKNVVTPLVQDSVSLKTKGAPGISFHVGYSVPNTNVTPYASVGFEYAQRELTYKATNLDVDISKNHRKPYMVFGIGMMGKVHDNMSLSFEAQRKIGQEFDLQIPDIYESPSLSNHRIRVGTSHWAIVATLTYDIPLSHSEKTSVERASIISAERVPEKVFVRKNSIEKSCVKKTSVKKAFSKKTSVRKISVGKTSRHKIRK